MPKSAWFLGLRTVLSQALLIVILSTLFVSDIPLSFEFGAGSTLASRDMDEVFGGVRKVEVALSRSTLNAFLAADPLAQEAWMGFLSKAPEPDLFVERQFGEQIDLDPAVDLPPEEFPFENRWEPWSGAAVTWASAAELCVFEKDLEHRIFGRLSPLRIAVERNGLSVLILFLAASVGGVLGRGFDFERKRLLSRLVPSLLCSALGLTLSLALAGLLWREGSPTLQEEWRTWLAGSESYDPVNVPNLKALATTCLAYLGLQLAIVALPLADPKAKEKLRNSGH